TVSVRPANSTFGITGCLHPRGGLRRAASLASRCWFRSQCGGGWALEVTHVADQSVALAWM
ncbi:hypothetical protein NDU88_010293, partial [Pleurodeles waltl]